MESPRFSIVIPVYNAEATLHDCLESVVRQSCGSWECLCVDDGSTDASAEIVRGYAVRDGRFRLIGRPHLGVGPARNAALDEAAGEYVVFVDADDTLKSDALSKLGEVDPSADVATFLCLDGRWGIKDERCRLFDRCVGNLLAWNAMYRREAVGGIRFPAIVNFEDVVFATRVFCTGAKVVQHECWYNHVDRPDSAMSRYTWRRVGGNISAGRMIWKSARDYIRRQDGFRRRFAMRVVLCRKLAVHCIVHVMAYAIKAVFRNGADSKEI